MININPASKNQPAGTVLASIKGPIKGRNWYSGDNPLFSITQGNFTDPSNTGLVKLQGTNTVAPRADPRDSTNWTTDLLPTDSAVWTDIQVATANTVSGAFAVEFKVLRLVIDTPGTGYVTNAYVLWS